MCGLIGTIGFKNNSKLKLETLKHRGPDFMGKWNDLQQIINVAPEVVSHNIRLLEGLLKRFAFRLNTIVVWSC